MSKLKPKEPTKVVRVRVSIHDILKRYSLYRRKPMTDLIAEMLLKELKPEAKQDITK